MVRNSIENRARAMMLYHSQSISYPSQVMISPHVQLVADVITAPPALLKEHNLRGKLELTVIVIR